MGRQVRYGWLVAILAGCLGVATTNGQEPIRGHEGAIQALAVSVDGKLLATAGADGVSLVIDPHTREVRHKIGPIETPLTGVVIQDENRAFYSSNILREKGAGLNMFSFADGRPIGALKGSDIDCSKVAASADRSLVAVRLKDSAVRVFFVTRGSIINLPSPPEGDVCNDLAMAPDGGQLAVCNSKAVYLFQVVGSERGLVGKHEPPRGACTAVEYTTDGKQILVGLSDGRVLLYKAGDDGSPRVFSAARSEVRSISVAPSGKYFTVGAAGGEVVVWDITNNREPLKQFRASDKAINAVAFIGNKFVASAGDDQLVRIWDTALKSEEEQLTGTASLESVAILRSRKRFPEAIEMLKQLGSESVKKTGAGSEETLGIMRSLADCQRAAGQYEAAIDLYKRCFRVSEPTIAADTSRTPDDVCELAMTIAASGDDKTAIDGLLKVKELRVASLGKNAPAVADIHFGLGRIHMARREWRDACAAIETCVDIRRRETPSRRDMLIDPLRALAHCYMKTDQVSKAEMAAKEAIELAEKHIPDTWRHVAAEVQLAEVYGDSGRPKEAGDLLFKRALVYVSENRLEPSEACARVLAELAHAFQVVGQNDKAIEFGRRACGMAECCFGPESEACIYPLRNLGYAHYKSRQVDQAEELYLRCREICAKRFGPDAWQGGVIESSLASVEFARNDLAAAESLYLKAIALHESSPEGVTGPMAATYQNLANIYLQQKKWKQAADCQTRAAQGIRASMYSVIPLLPDDAKGAFAVTAMAALRQPFSAAITHRDQQELVDASAEWLLNLKGFASEVLAERSAVASGGDETTRQLLRQLSAIRMRLASTAFSAAAELDADQRESLRQRERAIASELGVAMRDHVKSDAWVSLDQIRKTLPADSVIIEFRQMHYNTGRSDIPNQNVYVAWVIPPTGRGDVELILLGNQENLDRFLSLYLFAIEATLETIESESEAAAEAQLNRLAKSLSTGLVDAMPGIEKYDRWIVSPDGALWFVPWPALLTSDGKYVIENHQVEYVVTSRQLTWKKRQSAESNPPVIFANPDYDAGVRDNQRIEVFTQLPGTAKEAAAVTPFLKAYAKADPVVRMEERATEASIRRINSPKVLHLSTHGYFDALDTRFGERISPANPLMRCGLALAGANGALLSKDASGNDGVLSGMEVTGLNLSGTDLVVLSACQTGLGDLTRGEGVSGLRQAFQLAGAKTVVATLWSIPDDESAHLVASFFEQLNGADSAAAAMAKAQRKIIAERRKTEGGAHPFFWSAFGVTRTGE